METRRSFDIGQFSSRPSPEALRVVCDLIVTGDEIEVLKIKGGFDLFCWNDHSTDFETLFNSIVSVPVAHLFQERCQEYMSLPGMEDFSPRVLGMISANKKNDNEPSEDMRLRCHFMIQNQETVLVNMQCGFEMAKGLEPAFMRYYCGEQVFNGLFNALIVQPCAFSFARLQMAHRDAERLKNEEQESLMASAIQSDADYTNIDPNRIREVA